MMTYQRTDTTWSELISVHLKTSLAVPDMIQSGITAGFAFQIAGLGRLLILVTLDTSLIQLFLINQIFNACHICRPEPGRTINNRSSISEQRNNITGILCTDIQ